MQCWDAGGAPEMDQEQQAIWFLENLDKERHGSMLTVLKNNYASGLGFPATVEAAYLIAKDWMRSNARAADLRGVIARGAAFMLADDVRVLAIVPTASTTPKKKVQPKIRADPERSRSELLFRGP